MFLEDADEGRNVFGTLHFYNDQVAFADQARAHIQKYAGKNREAWRAQILGSRGESTDA